MKITIITATWNSYPEIADCMRSLAMQKDVDLEHITIDGGSSDETIPVIRSTFPRSIIISEPDRGIYDALNKGIRIATGDVIGFLHSDDLLASPTILSSVREEFERTGADGIYGDLVYVSRYNTRKIVRFWRSNSFRLNRLKYGWMPPHPSLFLRRSVYEKHGLFDLSFRIASDYDFVQRIFKDEELKFNYLPLITTRMRTGGTSNKSVKNIYQKMQEDYRAIRKNGTGGLYTLFFKNFGKIDQLIKREGGAI
ncbi:MAG: glycosyltransferase family 2 protein [Prolixibacteraceae bacterium]